MNDYPDIGLNIKEKGKNTFLNSDNKTLINKAVELGHGILSKTGSLVVETGFFTGRAAKDKYVVKNKETEHTIWWENSLNEMSEETFESLKIKAIDYLNKQENLFITERSVGAHTTHNIGARLISNRPSAALFSNHLFREKMREFDQRDFTILHVPGLEIDPEDYSDLRSKTVITTCFEKKITIIMGTYYAGEIKKSMFSVLNYLLPDQGILPMHAGANEGEKEGPSVFFGLSGTGKTTLSTDEGRLLIGDDEHALHDEGLFNFEGGCYAKTFKLSKEAEPGIWEASNRFGNMLENVVIDKKTLEVDFDDKSLSENGRSSYPLSFIEGIKPSSQGPLPKQIFFLCADAFGVLPPVSKLTKEQAMFYFVLGYTAKVAGTEIGVKEPTATFSPCFGAPFMLRHPSVYAELLGKFIEKHNIQVWLVNTGWTGGVYGVGERFPIKVTRQIIRAIQKDNLKNTPMVEEDIFGLQIPKSLSGVPESLLNPRNVWVNKSDYDEKAKELALSFHKKMKKFPSFYQSYKVGSPTYRGKTASYRFPEKTTSP